MNIMTMIIGIFIIILVGALAALVTGLYYNGYLTIGDVIMNAVILIVSFVVSFLFSRWLNRR